MNYLKLKRYILSTLFKDVNSFYHSQLKALKKIINNIYNFFEDFEISYFFRGLKYFNLKRYINFKAYKFNNLSKIFSFKKFENLTVYVVSFIFFSIIIYLNIPNIYKYEKSLINKTCNNFNIICVTENAIEYTLIPTPRLKVKNLTVQDQKKKTIATIPEASIKISIYKLINKNNFNFTKIIFNNPEINIYLDDIDEYKKIIKKLGNAKYILTKKGNINFFNKNKKITSINKTTVKLANLNNIKITGDFLGDELIASVEGEKDSSKVFLVKLVKSKMLAKININESKTSNKIRGDLLLKKNKHRIRSTFSYKNSNFFFEKGDVRNEFLNGQFEGFIKFLPFFDFDLNFDLKGFNFKRFYTLISNIDKKEISKFLKINYKINGSIDLNVAKVYSKYDLIDSFETNIKLSNSDIVIDKMLMNLGKLGAADLTGVFENDNKFSNFKFESNIYIDNEKYFTRKFGIFNDSLIFKNLYISGVIDLLNFNMRFSEISGGEKINEKQIFRIEKEFNTHMLENGFASLFDFIRLKEFLKSILLN